MQQWHTIVQSGGSLLIFAATALRLITVWRQSYPPPRLEAAGATQRFLCLSVDVQGYARNDDLRQAQIQHDLIDLLDQAGARAGLDRRRWIRQPAGDAELALIPYAEAPARVVGDFCLELAAALWRYNRVRDPITRMRLRLALDDGPADVARNGFAGQAVVGASRLVGAAPLRHALALTGTADLAVMLSDGVHRDWVRSGRSAVRPGWCRRVAVVEKEYAADAWLWLPGADVHGLVLAGH
ncbi:hypothetical protein ACFO1B_03035 [Dactylosporangium siamense]|uniref:Uncharacterized protein n=1 Tax=Dactylosporangium siamense TaxID=685454 RepID=A0A919UIH8_9ACTN|nr:hypothetical protein [Dactylosporangium siamense]GIG52660.1 hypothetical protein Dsi01nite_107010 [Dactylosporangium siamense]